MAALNSESFVIEGNSLVFTFTLDTAVSTTTSYNWKVVPQGTFPALSSDFTSLTGTVSFAAGESEKTITITTTENTAGAVDRSFMLEIRDSSDNLVVTSEIITLEEDDDRVIEFLGSVESDVLGAATSFDISRMDGFGGDDYYIITQYQQGDVSISDDVGTNVIKFDYGVEITDFSETSRFGGRQVASFTVTLKSGAEISVASPKGTFSYQIGDGEVLDYDAFKAAIDAFGTNSESTLAEPFTVETSTPSPDLTSDTESVPLIEILGGDDGDVLGAATSLEISRMSGFGGNDYYIITQYQQGDVSISDDAGANVIKFDYGVEITGFSETSRFGGRQVAHFTVTLESGAEINVASPKGTLSYQIGNGGVLDYDAFKAAIGASGTNDGSALANFFPVPFPAVIDNHGPVFTSLGSVSVTEDIGEDATIYIAAAADADGDTVSYSITGGNDAGVFGIDASTGVVSLISGQSLDAEGTSSYTLTITASSQARGEAAKTETLDVDITVTNVNDEAPVITSSASGGALDEGTQIAATQAIYTAAGTFDVTPIVWSLKAGNSDDAALFSIDISSGAVTFQSDTTPDFEAKPSYDFTIVATSGSLSAEQDVSIAVTNVDEGSAVFTVTSSGGDINAVVEGNVLTLGVSTSDPDGDGTFTYQWHRDGSDISGANSESYTVVDDDEETSLTVTVSYTDSSGMAESVTTAPVVLPPDNIATGLGLSNPNTQISEDTTARTRIGEVTFDDADGGDSGTLELAGANAALFELDDTTLYLRAGASLDYETVTTLEVRVQLTEDTSVGVDVPITITNANDIAPMITSGASGLSIDENAEVLSSTVIYTATADVDITAATWSLKAGNGDDAALFNIDSTTGAVMFRDATTPDFEAKSSYAFTVIATSGGLDGVEQVVTVGVNNRNDVRPVITSAAQPNIDERTVFSTNAAFYTAAGTFDVEEIIWSLKDNNGDDADLFDIDTASGVVTFKSATTPDHEVKDSYSFTVIATSGSLEAVEQDVTVGVNNRNDVRPVITSAAQPNIDERTVFSTNTAFYTAAGTFDVEEIIWSLKDNNGDDADLFDIDTASGVVTFKSATTPDHEVKDSYSFTVIATSGSLEAVEQDVTIDINDINDQNPKITSSGTIPNIDEGTEISSDTVLYTATGTYDVTPITWLIRPSYYNYIIYMDQGALFNIDSTSGEVTFKTDTTPDYEIFHRYRFTVMAKSGSRETLKEVTIYVNDDPLNNRITSDPTGLTFVEGTEVSADTVIYTATGITHDRDIFSWHLRGDDEELFNIKVIDSVTAEVTFKVDTTPDFDTQSSYSLTIVFFLEGVGAFSQHFTIAVTNIDEGDAEFDVSSTGNRNEIAVGDVLTAVLVTPDPDGASIYTYQWHRDGVDIAGANDDSYTAVADDVGAVLTVTVSYIDDTNTFETVMVAVTDSHATAIALDEGAVTEIGEDAGTAARVKIADLVITNDDGRGYGTLELAGDNAALFEVDDTVLYLIEGASLDHETLEALSVRVQVAEDTSVGVDVSLTVTDADEGDAVYVIDDADSGLAEHIADASSLAVGSTLYARLSSDDPDGNGTLSYQWKRGGGDIVGATAVAYIITAADLGRALTVTVSYTDDSGTSEHVTPDAIDIPAAPVSANQASFIITSDGSVDTPLVGDELRVTLDTPDPDGDGAFTYQWFVVDGPDIVGATSATYRIIEADQTIGVRVSYTDDDGTAETVTTELSVASVLVNPDAYTLIKIGDGSGEDTLAGTSADEIIQGGSKGDTITTGGGDDIVIGGYGRDTVTLSNDGAETVVYRFSSDVVTEGPRTGWIAIDGADRIDNFERGVDKLVLVDVDGTPIDFAGLLAGGDSFRFGTIFDSSDLDVIVGVRFQFAGSGLDAGKWFAIFFKDAITVYEDYSTDTTTTAEGTRLIGLNGEHHDTTTDPRSDRSFLTDLSLIPNYFQTADADFADGLQVIEMSELGVDIVNPYVYTTVVKHANFHADNTLTGTTATELIQGSRGNDGITTGGGGDIVTGGYGRDEIILSDDGAETLVYRFSSDVVTEGSQTGWAAVDGADRISNFERGVDKLVLVDVDGTPIDLAGFLAGGSAFRFATIVDSSDDHVITGVSFQFAGRGFDDGPGGSGNAGKWLSIFFKDTITVYEDYSTDMTTTAEGTRLLGLNGEHHDTTGSRSDRWLLTDFSLIPNYFQTADADFADGLQVIEVSELGVDII